MKKLRSIDSPIFYLSVLFFILSLFQVIRGVGRVVSTKELIDFKVYYQAVNASLLGQNPYFMNFGENIPFNYPPSSLLFLAPLTFLTPQSSEIILTDFSIISLLLGAYMLTSLFQISRNWTIRLLIFSFLLQNFPTKFTLVMGQVNLILLLLIITSFNHDQNNRPIQSGFLYGTASMVKLIPLPLGIYFLLRRKYLALATGIITFIAANVFVTSLFPNTGDFFLKRIFELSLLKNTIPTLYDQSLKAFFLRIGFYGNTQGISLIIVAFLFTITAMSYFKKKIKKKDRILNDLTFFSLILAITTIGNSFTWQHHLVFLFPGFIAETTYVLRNRVKIRGILLFLSAVLVGYHFPDIAHPPTTNPIFISHGTVGALILIFLLLTNSRGNLMFLTVKTKNIRRS